MLSELINAKILHKKDNDVQGFAEKTLTPYTRIESGRMNYMSSALPMMPQNFEKE